MFTVEEALTKWCPMARVGNATGCNRYSMDHDAAHASAFAKCIGSNCMMWQWADPKTVVYHDKFGNSSSITEEPARPKWVPDDYEWVPGGVGQIGHWKSPPKGFCGLAGRPV